MWVIDVRDCRAIVSRWAEDGLALRPAANWPELEGEAIQAVCAQGGGINISGLYYCPLALSRKAKDGGEQCPNGTRSKKSPTRMG